MGSDITLVAFVELVLRQSPVGLFAVFIFALLKGWLVVGDQHNGEMRQQAERYEALLGEKERQLTALTVSRDRWERIALKALNVSEQTASLAESRKEAQ